MGLHGSVWLDGWARRRGADFFGASDPGLFAAAQKGSRGERRLAAVRHMAMGDLFQKLEQISEVPSPRWTVPLPVLYAMAAANEIWTGINKRPAPISLATRSI